MKAFLNQLQSRLVVKIIIPIGLVLFVSISLLSVVNLRNQREIAHQNHLLDLDRVATTLKLGMHYSMLLNSRQDTAAIVSNYAKLSEIRGIRIMNKTGMVMFASDQAELGQVVNMDDPRCQVCHAGDKPLLALDLSKSVYKVTRNHGERVAHLISPIPNEPTCSSESACHYHDDQERVLGYLDMEFSQGSGDSLIDEHQKHTVGMAFLQFFATFLSLSGLLVLLIKRPITAIMGDALRISQGEAPKISVKSSDEIGQLARAIHKMGSDLVAKNDQLTMQKNMYQRLFEGVPCLVTVQDRDYKLLSYNRTFAERFNAKIGDFCFKAYKNRDSKCPDCPVELTFATGEAQVTEESGCYRDGSKANWIVNTSPVYDSEGNIIAAVEMCLDITERKKLEQELKTSERKYVDIFNNIPSAVFVLDQADFAILDCNRNAVRQYGWEKDELADMSFADLFEDKPGMAVMEHLAASGVIDQARHRTRDGRVFFVSINAQPSSYASHPVLLVSVTDITKRLETEQQLIQASKMATLGEMSTGVAHELNQPLSVISSSVGLIGRQASRDVPDLAVLARVGELIGSQVERASKIINHLREFGRRPDMNLVEVNVNELLTRTFDFFQEQFSLRSIETVWELDERLPLVRCEPNRMEQVIINLLVNARDAIEERCAAQGPGCLRRIAIKTMFNQKYVTIRLSDTGPGVDPSIAPRIFEPFFTTKQVGKGTGLGLSISYGIIKDFGGTISVTANEHQGASFYIRLPLAGGQAE